jgi:hypothetical protein
MKRRIAKTLNSSENEMRGDFQARGHESDHDPVE